MTDSYYTLKSRTAVSDHADDGVVAVYESNIHAQGAWNPHEQHMAPATGVMCAELEAFMPRADMRIGRISLDIFGLIAFGEFSIHTKLIRKGRTIELIEAVMMAHDKTCITARAWRMQTSDTSAVAGLENSAIASIDDLPDWEGIRHWGGGYIKSIRAKADPNNRHGRGIVWLNNSLDMVACDGKTLPTSDFVHLMGMVDTANGIVPRIYQPDGINWLFPNLDLQIHLLRLPVGRWLGFDTMQQIGDDGVGLTSSVLHDEQGVFGHSEQILTIRAV
ncbi:MAG: thioesterase family protein [Moraxella sp.]|nr:thioesterase family protein [Moraxella sp.]